MAVPRPEPTLVTVHDVGLTVLHDPVDSIADIVFVHGLQGHPRRTWATKKDADAGPASASRKKSPLRGLKTLILRKKGNSALENSEDVASEVFWPSDLLPKDCANLRILTWGYESSVSRFFGGAANQNSVFAHARDLMYALEDARRSCRTRTLIFIVHSLGGIIVKDVLRRAAGERSETLNDIFTSTKAVLFLGTPHRGSNMAETAEMLRRLANASGFSTNDRNIRTLHINSTELEIVHEEFMKLYQRNPRPFEVSTFQEAQGLTGVNLLGLGEKVVDDASSSFTGTERCQTINANHMGMCRFSTKDDNGYKKVVSELKTFLSAIQEEIAKETTAAAVRVSSTTVSSIYSLDDIERLCISLFNTSDIGEYRSILPRCEEGTCQWILSDPQYICWYSEENSCLLWISGHPGTGKTILSSYILSYLSENISSDPSLVLRRTVCFFFCDGKIESQRDGTAILRSLIHQILVRRRKLIRHIKAAYDVQGPRLIDNFNELWRLFKAISTDKGAGSISIIIDAIDECEEMTRRRFLEAIATLMNELKSTSLSHNLSIKFLVTSRPLLSRQYPISHLQIEDLERNTIQDLRLVIHRKIDGIAKRTNCRAEARMYLEQALYSKADRTFLWVSLVINLLERTPFSTQGEFQRLVERLPQGLIATYERFLFDIPDDYQESAANLLHFIVGSKRSLSLNELQILFALQDSHKSIKDLEADSQTNIRETVERILGPFVRISDNHVNLVHQSARDFLDELWKQQHHPLAAVYGIDPAKRDALLAKSCMLYLSLDDFGKDIFTEDRQPILDSPTSPENDRSDDESLYPFWDTLDLAEDAITKDPDVAEWDLCKSIAETNPFFDYAALHWASHFASCSTLASPQLQQSALFLSDSNNLASSNWFRYHWRHCEVDLVLPTNFTPFITGCFLGHLTTVKTLLSTDLSITQELSSRGLYWASWKGHSTIVSYLLTQQTQPNWKSSDRHTPLTVAARFDHLEVVKLLLQTAGIDVNDRGRGGRTALSMAAGNGHLTVVEQLLQHSHIQPDLPDYSQWTPIFWAVGGKYPGIVRRFALDERVDLNHVDKTGRGILSWAAGEGDTEIVNFLLNQEGVNIQQRDHRGRNALSWAAENGHLDVVFALRRSKRVDVFGRDNEGKNAISWAATGGHPEVVRYLIKYDPEGADRGDKSGWTPLAWGLDKNSPDTIKALLESGLVDPRRRDRNGRSILSWARGYRYTEVVELLIAAIGSDQE